MNAKKRFGSKTYFIKMVLLISTALLIVVAVFSAASYMNAKNLLTKVEQDSNHKLLYQVKYNINMMNSLVSNLVRSLYVNSDISSIMYAKQEDIIALSEGMNRVVSTVQSSSPYFHSIMVYNSELDQFYSAGTPSSFDREALLALWGTNQVVPRMAPVFHDIKKTVNNRIVQEPVFSYFMYETSRQQDKPSSVLIINVKPEWLLDHIESIQATGNKQDDFLFITDRNGAFIEYGVADLGVLHWLKEASVEAPNLAKLEGDGHFESSYNGTRYQITYTKLDSVGMTLFNAKPVSNVHHYMNQMNASFLLLTFIFLAVAVIISFTISRKLYRPLGRLLQPLSHGDQVAQNGHQPVDELAHLGQVMKNYWLNRLLTGSLSNSWQESEKLFMEMGIALPFHESYAVVTLKIDRYQEFQAKYGAKEQEAIRSELIQASAESLDRVFPAEGLDMGGDHAVMIVAVGSGENDYMLTLAPCMEQVQQLMLQRYGITCTVSVGAAPDGIQSLQAAYTSALYQANYRFILGHGAIIGPEAALKYESNCRTGYAKKSEERLVEMVRLRKFDMAEATLGQIIDEIRMLNYYQSYAATLRLVDVLNDCLSGGPINRNVLACETIFELRLQMREALAQEELAEEPKAKNHFAVEAIREYIQSHLSDPSMSLTSIADLMNIPARRLSKVYKEGTGQSIPEFITAARLQEASVLLRSGLSVQEVAIRVGIVTETYFFSLFKKQFGMTPKEYALQRNSYELNDTHK